MRIIRCLFIGFLILNIPFFGVFGQEEPKKPVVMVMINEQIWVGENIIYDYYGSLADAANLWTSVSQADTTFISTLFDKGFTVVGGGLPVKGEAQTDKNDILRAIEGDTLKSKALGGSLKADVVIVGKAVAKAVEMVSSSPQKSARANITVRAIDVATGQIIAVESGDATAVAIDEISAGVDAIKQAALPVSETIANMILE